MLTSKPVSVVKKVGLLLLIGLYLAACVPAESLSTAAGGEPGLLTPQPVPQSVPHPVTPLQPAADAHENEFAIHLVGQSITAAQLIGSSINEVALEGSPILTQSDIVAYDWDTHQMELTSGAYEKLAGLEDRTVSEGGLGFVACVGDERIYTGAFWSSLSSAVFPGPVIDVHGAALAQPLTIQLGYPSEEWFTGIDARDDGRIRQSLQKTGKLR
jgi:hypothetical protein